MTFINTNTSSIIAGDAISRNDRAMPKSTERLSTGLRNIAVADTNTGA